MEVEPAVSWSELAAIIYGLVLEGRETESGRGPTDLFALADSLAEAAGGAVTIEDKLSRLLAYSKLQQHADPARVETIVGRQAPENLRALFEPVEFSHIWRPPMIHSSSPGTPVRGLTGRMVVAVRSGRELLGSVWVACSAPLDGPARSALADGGRTVALHLLRSRASADLERQVESELVIRLLEGTADAATAASRLGLPPALYGSSRFKLSSRTNATPLFCWRSSAPPLASAGPGLGAVRWPATPSIPCCPASRRTTARRWVSGLRAALTGRREVDRRHQRRRPAGRPPDGTRGGR